MLWMRHLPCVLLAIEPRDQECEDRRTKTCDSPDPHDVRIVLVARVGLGVQDRRDSDSERGPPKPPHSVAQLRLWAALHSTSSTDEGWQEPVGCHV